MSSISIYGGMSFVVNMVYVPTIIRNANRQTKTGKPFYSLKKKNMLNLLRRLLSQRGEVQAPAGGTQAYGTEVPSAPSQPAQSPWYSTLPADLQNDPTIKATPDVATLAKRFVDTNREFGSRIKLPGPNSTPQEIEQLRQKMYESKVFKAPPKTPQDYQIKRPDSIPEQAWKPEIETKYREWAHRHGITDEAIQEGMAIQAEQFQQTLQAYEVDHEQANKFIADYARELRVQPQELMSAGDRFLNHIFKSNPAGLDHFKNALAPEVMVALGHAGLLMQQSNGFIGDEEFVNPAQQNYLKEADDIVRNKENPKYKRYWQGDQAVVAEVNSLYQKAVPGEREI